MKTLVLLSLSLAVILGTPVPPSGVEKEENQSPLLGDLVPVQGHVIVENPAPQVVLGSKEKRDETAPVDLKPKGRMVENDIKEEPEVKEEDNTEVDEPAPGDSVEAETEIKQEMEEELQAEPDFKVESEVKVEPGVQIDPEEELKLQKAQEEFQVDGELDPEERYIDMERRFESEPQDDDSMFGEEEHHEELSEEDLRREDPVAELLPEEEEEEEDMVEGEEELLGKNVEEDQPAVEVGAEGIEEPVQDHVDMPVLDEETSLDTMEQQMNPEIYVPDEEAGVEMFSREEQLYREPAMEDGDTGHSGFRGHYCSGMVAEGKCYLFFGKPKTHADAEFFCHQRFPEGHLASITSQHIHRQLMNLILMQNGALTRTWVGGRRLDSRRFFWLDGSLWSYSDWLLGEPNNTSGLEDCVEVLQFGNGKFNDFTCWEPQAFICSYPV